MDEPILARDWVSESEHNFSVLELGFDFRFEFEGFDETSLPRVEVGVNLKEFVRSDKGFRFLVSIFLDISISLCTGSMNLCVCVYIWCR